MADPALILSMGHIQGVMRPILDAPALLFQVQPAFLIQLGLGANVKPEAVGAETETAVVDKNGREAAWQNALDVPG